MRKSLRCAYKSLAGDCERKSTFERPERGCMDGWITLKLVKRSGRFVVWVNLFPVARSLSTKLLVISRPAERLAGSK